MYEEGKLHGTATFLSHTGDKEERCYVSGRYYRNEHLVDHPKLTRVRNIRYFLFEIKRVLVYDSTIFKLTDLFIYTFSFKTYILKLSI